MTNLILFDGDIRAHLLPLTFLRPVSELRLGLLTIREKWEYWMNGKASFVTEDYLSANFPLEVAEDNLLISSAVLPSEQLCRLLRNMEFGEAYLYEDELIAARLDEEQLHKLIGEEDIESLHVLPLHGLEIQKISKLTDFFSLHANALESDFHLITAGRKSQPLSNTNRVIAPERIFVEPGAWVEGAVLNAQNGPIYIGSNATVMEGSAIRGGLALCEHATVKMGAQLYGPNTIGPWSKVGGELEQCIFQAYSNKAHHGYLGQSYIGEWCNIGAGTTASNLRNDYATIKFWDYPKGKFADTGETLCGLIMGDHSRLGINMMINSGTSIGMACNLYGDGFPRNFIPSFTMGGASGLKTFAIDQAIYGIERMMARRKRELTIEERLTIIRLFEDTAAQRSWEKRSS